MKKIKILFVDHTPFKGGSQLRLSSHIKTLDKSKFSPLIATDKNSQFNHIYSDTRAKIFEMEFGVLKRIAPETLQSLVLSLVEFKKIIKKTDPDLVLSNTTRALVISGLAKTNYKLVAYIRDYDYPKWLLKLLAARVDKFLLVSDAVGKYYKLDSKKCEVVYLGSEILDKRVRKDLSRIKNLKKELGLKKNDLVIGFVGRLVFDKGPLILLKAFHRVQNPKCKLVFFGTGQGQRGDIESEIKFEIKRLNLENKVKMAGFVSDPYLIYKTLDIYVLPSLIAEGFPTTIIEAALSKVAIIASNTGGTGEFIKNNINGLLIRPGDIDQLTKSIDLLVKKKSLAKRLVNRAFIDAQALTETSITKKLEDFYRQMAIKTPDSSR